MVPPYPGWTAGILFFPFTGGCIDLINSRRAQKPYDVASAQSDQQKILDLFAALQEELRRTGEVHGAAADEITPTQRSTAHRGEMP